jgi:hypothetical protein
VGSGTGIQAGQVAASAINQGNELYIVGCQLYGGAGYALGIGILIEDCDAVYVRHSGIGMTANGNIKMVAGGYGVHNHFVMGTISDITKSGHGLYITGTGTAAEIFLGGNSWFCSAGQVSGGMTTLNGIRVDVSNLGQMRITDSHIYNNKGAGLYITNSGAAPVAISANTFQANGSGGNANNNSAIYINSGSGSQSALLDGNYDAGSTGVSLQTSATANQVYVGANYWASGHSYGVAPAKDLGW